MCVLRMCNEQGIAILLRRETRKLGALPRIIGRVVVVPSAAVAGTARGKLGFIIS